ncbi:MAG: response regulator [Deltaproteobacteria bacterium]|nr:response regulator [Deltaproteobacteria bacterium]
MTSGSHGWPVLVVEDDHEIRESLLDILFDQGIGAVGAVNGRDGLTKLAAAGGEISLVLLDMMMPVLDGDGFREEQLREPRFADVPVVVMSAYRDVASMAGRLGVAGYMRKPFNVAEVLNVVNLHRRQVP